jgi:hypothetical protein
MNSTSGVPSRIPNLEVRDDEAFESRVRAAARARLRRAHGQAGSTRLARETEHARRWRRTAASIALAAFGAGLLWPVASPEPESPVQAARPVRVLQGALLASLDAPAQQAH